MFFFLSLTELLISFNEQTKKDAQEFLRCFMDELHNEMTILRSTLSDQKDRSESSSSENSEIPLVLPRLIRQVFL